MTDVNDFCVTNIRTVFFESDSEYDDLGVFDKHAFFVHDFDCLICDIFSHTVVEMTSR